MASWFLRKKQDRTRSQMCIRDSVQSLVQQFTMLNEDRSLLERLRSASLSTSQEITWAAAGKRLLDVYRETIEAHLSGD